MGAVSHLTAAGAIRGALGEAMAADARLVVLGEAVGRLGGLHHCTGGLLAQYGPRRVIDTPLSEAGLVGLAAGMAAGGGIPVVSLIDADRAWEAAGQILRELRGLGRGEWPGRLVLRLPIDDTRGPTPEPGVVAALVAGGLRVASPATPADAGGLLRAALAASGPTALLEPASLYGRRGAVDGEPTPFGQPRIARAGEHCTVLAWGPFVAPAIEAAEALEAEGIRAEIIDLRSLSPRDDGALGAAVRRTGRVVVAGEGGFARELLSAVTRAAFLYLESPPATAAGSAAALAAAVRASVRF